MTSCICSSSFLRRNKYNDDRRKTGSSSSFCIHWIVRCATIAIILHQIAVYCSISKQTHDVQYLKTHDDELLVVPFQLFYSCHDSFEQVACNHTIILEDSDNHPIRGIITETGPDVYDEICNEIWEKGGTKPVAYIPVCIQNARNFGIAAYINQLDNKVHLVENRNDYLIEDFLISNDRLKPRMVSLKRVDFPSHYRGLVDTKNYIWERYRDENYGNMVWRYSASMLLNQATTLVDQSDNWATTNLTYGPVDALVVATANTLHITQKPELFDHINTITERIEQRNVPTVVIGIGIQFEFDSKDENPMEQEASLYTFNETKLALPFPFQRRFLTHASRRQIIPAIGVRGDMTRTICKNSGIQHCVSMGCPSLTISREINLGKTLETNWNAVIRRMKANEDIQIAVTFPAYAKGNDFAFSAVEFVVNILEAFPNGQVTIIQQDKADSIRMEKFLRTQWREVRPNSLLVLTNGKAIKYEEYNNVESWLAGAKKFDLCLSSRIHGSMTFIGSGVPTVAIPTDFRIMELLVSMKIPHILPQALRRLVQSETRYNVKTTKSSNAHDRYEMILKVLEEAKYTNFHEFELNRREKIRGWKTILASAGLEMDPALVHILSAPLKRDMLENDLEIIR